jgi:putative Ig domain-containing protein
VHPQVRCLLPTGEFDIGLEMRMRFMQRHVGPWLIALLGLASATAHAQVAPKISGSPSTEAVVGTWYRFTPRAWDGDGDTLRFAIVNKPAWASFDPATGRLAGTPKASGTFADIKIRVTDGTFYRALPSFSIVVVGASKYEGDPTTSGRKAHYGHYFSSRDEDTVEDLAMLCEQAGVQGVIWRRAWYEIEPSPGVYDFGSYDAALRGIQGSHNPQCQLWIFVEFKGFNSSTYRNPCPAYLQAQHSALNVSGRASSCFMWEPIVANAYIRMMRAAAARYDSNPHVEGFIFQESALNFYDAYSQDVADGGTYTAEAWRDALVNMIGACGAAFTQSRCVAFLNFIRNGQQYLHDVSRALSAIPDNGGCMSGPDLLPDSKPLYDNSNSAYEVLTRHKGCRSNSAQNDSYKVRNFDLNDIFNFAVRGRAGDFDETYPRGSGVCVNSYLFWNHRTRVSSTGQDWTSALPVIAAYPYGRMWLDQCAGGGGPP